MREISLEKKENDMLRKKTQMSFFNVLVLISIISALLMGQVCFGEDEAEVTIKKIDGRSEAIVKRKYQPSSVPVEKEIAGDAVSKVEKGTFGVAQKSTILVGKGADQTVKTVQKVSEPWLVRLFHFLDFSRKKEQATD